MKVLIAYISRNGTVKKCADMLADFLPSTVESELIDLSAVEFTEDMLKKNDAVVLIGAVHMGSIHKKIKEILKLLSRQMPQYPCALAICCGYSDRYDEYSGTQLPIKYRPPLGVYDFGGELKPDGLKGFDKFVVKRMRQAIKELDFEDSDKRDICLPEIMPENIKLLADNIKKVSLN